MNQKALSRAVRFSLPEIDRYTWVLLPLASSFIPPRYVPRKIVNKGKSGTCISSLKKDSSTSLEAQSKSASSMPPSSTRLLIYSLTRLRAHSFTDRTTTVISHVVVLILEVWMEWLRCELWEPGPSHKKIRSALLRARLLSREFDDLLRPWIISQLRLSSAADVHVLLKMLRSNNRHGRLSQAVKYLELLDDGSGLVDFERSCKLLASKLPSLKGLGYNVLQTGKTDRLPMMSLPPKAILASFAELCVFSLLGVKIHSLSVLVQVLGALPKLKQLALHRVEWIYQSDSGPPARLFPPFSCLRLVIADDMLAWPLMYLWSSMLERRRSAASKGSNTDAESLSSLVKMCCESSSTTRMVMRYDPGAFMGLRQGVCHLMHNIQGRPRILSIYPPI